VSEDRAVWGSPAEAALQGHSGVADNQLRKGRNITYEVIVLGSGATRWQVGQCIGPEPMKGGHTLPT
jgi:hypothetical protein